MKIPDWCVECVGKYICKVEVKRGDERCVNFHNALESKLQSAVPTNKQSESLLCESGFATVKGSAEKPYWITCDDSSKDGFVMDDGQPLEMSPSAFKVGTVLMVFEPESE